MEVLHISPNQSKSWENLVIAGLAQLVERQFPKLKVAGSRPVARSRNPPKKFYPCGIRPKSKSHYSCAFWS